MQSYDAWLTDVKTHIEAGGWHLEDEEDLTDEYNSGRSAEDVAKEVLNYYTGN